MAASTLIVGRVFLKRIDTRKHDLRAFVLLSQANDHDRAYGTQWMESQCPRIPAEIRRYYAKANTLMADPLLEKSTVLMYKDLKDLPYTPLHLVSYEGGEGRAFLSALLWTAFKSKHVHLMDEISETSRPRVGDTVTILKPKDVRRGHTGTITYVDLQALGVIVQFADGQSEGFRFTSLYTTGRGTYPLRLPPHAGELPPSTTTVLQCSDLVRGLSLSMLRFLLPDIALNARARGYTAVALLVGSESHIVAAFPCPTFETGWMFCNTWKPPWGGCTTFSHFLRAMTAANNLSLRDLSVLYLVQPQ
jgi:hypothetical protein